VAEGGHQVADYLTQHGPEGVLTEVQEFARRRPGAFLATAIVSGFVVGRLGRGVISAAGTSSTNGSEPSTAGYAGSTAGYGSMGGYEGSTAGYAGSTAGYAGSMAGYDGMEEGRTPTQKVYRSDFQSGDMTDASGTETMRGDAP